MRKDRIGAKNSGVAADSGIAMDLDRAAESGLHEEGRLPGRDAWSVSVARHPSVTFHMMAMSSFTGVA